MLQPAEREKLLNQQKIEGQFAKLETSFREILLKSRVFKEDSLPGQMIAEIKEEVAAHSLDAAKEKKSTQIQEKEVAQVLDPKSLQGDVDDAASGLTHQAVFERLSNRGLRQMVFVLIDEQATPVVIQGSATDDEPMPDAQPLIDPTWKEGILCAIELPHVLVETIGKKGKESWKANCERTRKQQRSLLQPRRAATYDSRAPLVIN